MSARRLYSISPYLPLQHHQGSFRWLTPAEHALKAVVRGPDTSMVNSALALYDFIDDIRTENGLKPISPQSAVGLSRLCDEMEDTEGFFNSTLPNIAKLALQLPELLELHEREIRQHVDTINTSMVLRILSPQEPGMVLLHQHLIAALLACAFFCLFPRRKEQREVGLVNINFDGLYAGVAKKSTNVQKLLCLVHYFRRVGKHMPGGSVSFERKVLPMKSFRVAESDGRVWSDSKKPLCELKVVRNGAVADAGSDYLQVDFANEQLGGGALHTGCVQEEICFMVSPECIVGMLFLPTMADNESIEITGAETFSQHAGYGHSFRFAGDYSDDNTSRDSWGRRMKCVGAIDALCFPGENQFKEELMMRELNKAYCGFLNHSALCGFGGAPDVSSTESMDVDSGENLWVGRMEESQSSVSDYEANTVHKQFSYLNRDEKGQKLESTGTCVIHQKLKGVATGNWGAGAFGGNLQLKSFLQWLAASQAECLSMLYYSFGDSRAEGLEEVVEWIHQEKWCVSELWNVVQQYGKCRINHQVKPEIYEWILPNVGPFPH